MQTVTELRRRLSAAADAQGARYARGEERPLRGYAVTMSVYLGTVALLGAAIRISGTPLPDGLPGRDLALCAVATHKLSRLIAKDPVTSPLRAPFTTYEGTQGPSELAEQVRGDGARKSIGELLTCPFCTGMWVVTGFTAGLVLAPRPTRIAMGALSALAGADLLQFARTWVTRTAE